MGEFIVSARKYRPKAFSDVVGQSNVTSTLLNALKNGQLSQAYLFCGPRGVGKTTCARILASIVNEQEDGTEVDQSFSVFELDAASNNSVEDIRSLIDQVRIPPQTGQYKVYIIDEVHMLSSAAFNAFLKTLEEPPPHAIFILATTEKHKILPTILSRCQIFDFNRISIEETVEHLKNIGAKENVNVEEEALYVIAGLADGALRDALTIFDQMVAFGEGEITYKGVIKNLHVVDQESHFAMLENFIASDISSTLLQFNEILRNGHDGLQFVLGLGEHLRNLLVSRDPATAQLLDTSAAIKEKLVAQGTNVSEEFILTCLDIVRETDVQYRASKNKKLTVEIALMQMASVLKATGKAEEKKST